MLIQLTFQLFGAFARHKKQMIQSTDKYQAVFSEQLLYSRARLTAD